VTFWDAILLGAVQGLTEFLPISSSGHLILVPWLLGRPAGGLTFDVALHLGTLVVLLIYFWRDWLHLLGGVVALARGRPDGRARLLGLLIVGTIPAVMVGLVAERIIEEQLRSPYLAAVLLAGVGALFLVAEQWAVQRRALKDVGLADALLIGCAQATALVPGVSRSGITIVAGLWLGLRRDEAARFSFLMATPVIAGAGILRLRTLTPASMTAEEWALFAAGFAAAAVFGLLAIAWLLAYLRRRSLAVFAYYRLALAALIVGLALTRTMP
jgi:undecaprenyl-diphosphatase